ncbi:MAG: endonuclease/exonuclease/phosphatase family protein [Bdellovibrionales bacterium]|nr:endonuclease/exonuclease/phosphatase family protein [Bdellovibrionales bacterium]
MEVDTIPVQTPPLLKIMVLNAQDLFLFMDKHDLTSLEDLTETKWQLMSSSLFFNKSKDKCLSLAQTIRDSNADIVMMTEVGGHESLANFARFVLNDEYTSMSLPSNSERGIDLGYLIKKNLSYTYALHTHIDFQLPAPARRFSRDVLRLDLIRDEKIEMILLLVHIKSKLDMKKADFEGRTRRVLEVKGLLQIYQKLLVHQVPILVGGDFNGHAGEKDTEEEFKQIYQNTDLKDIAFLANIPEEERFSYIYFTRGGNRFVQQIDYLFISEKFAHLIEPSECYFPRYKNPLGVPLPIPKRMEQKNTMPSDHYPFLASIRQK